MHVLTGFLLAGLFGKQQAANLLAGLQNGPVCVAHAVPGRIRFRVKGLADEPNHAALLREKLTGIEGVKQVAVTPASGSVLIQYREKVVQPDLLFAAVVRLLGLDAEFSRTPPPAVVRELQHVLDSLNRVVYDRTNGLLDFNSVVIIILAGLGIKKLVLNESAALPAGATLLWWAVSRLLGQGEE
jgi:hypothetical protein